MAVAAIRRQLSSNFTVNHTNDTMYIFHAVTVFENIPPHHVRDDDGTRRFCVDIDAVLRMPNDGSDTCGAIEIYLSFTSRPVVECGWHQALGWLLLFTLN